MWSEPFKNENSSHTTPHEWPDDSTAGVVTRMTKGQRVIILHTSKGFNIPKLQFVTKCKHKNCVIP